MSGQVLDYSAWRPSSPEALIAAGVVGVMRYVGPAAWQKALSPDELAGLLHAGLKVGFNFESTGKSWRGGFAAGVTDGQLAGAAMRRLGLPATAAVFYSADEDVNPAQFGTLADYIRGCGAGSGYPAEFYGEGAAIEFLAANGHIKRGWLTNASGWFGSSSPTPHTVLHQHYNQQVANLPGAYDVNDVIQADWGQFPASIVPPPPKPIARSDDDVFFYKVTDNAAVSPNTIWMSNGFLTRGVHDLAELAVLQWCAAVSGVQNVQVINTVPYAVHARFVQGAAPANVSIDVGALAAALAQHLALVGK